MAFLNTKTGFCGYTIDTTGNISDKNGNVNKCIFAINYPLQSADVNFNISTGAEDWAAQMGDGTIIPLSNPVILYQNRDNSIVEFTLATSYPANSFCFLVYRSDSATMGITARSDTRPFEVNSVCGYFAFTVDEGDSFENGYTKRLQATIPYPHQSTDVDFMISNDPSHWGVRMGDGSIIALREPVVLFSNRDNAVIQFKMDTAYPSNSPGVLVYRSSNASLQVIPRSEDEAFIPVTDIIGLPDNIITNVPFILDDMNVIPYNASVQTIVWEVVTGPAVIEDGQLIATGKGSINIKASIPKGLDESTGYFKNFTVNAIENKITIISQPVSNINLTLNQAGDTLTVNATSDTTKIMRYQWYKNNTNSTTNGTIIDGATKSSYDVPFNRVGHVYYYCKVSADGAKDVFTNVCDVYVSALLGSIFISNAPSELYINDTYTLQVGKDNMAADPPKVTWSSSDSYIAQINKDTGQIIVLSNGSVTFTATTIDGKLKATCTVVIPKYVSVTNITGLITEMDTDTNVVLTGTVTPNDATVKTIEWQVLDGKGTNAYINNGTIRAPGVGSCLVRATIRKGISVNQDYVKDFYITINKKFVPVSSVDLFYAPLVLSAGDIALLSSSVSPENATYRDVEYSISSAGATGATISGDLLTVPRAGILEIKATIKKGLSETRDYTRTFQITVGAEFVAVENILNIPADFEHVDQPLQLAGTVYPTNATMKNITYKIKSSQADAKVSLNLSNQLIIDYENVTWWNRNPNATPPDYFDQWLPNITQPIVIEMRVANGAGPGQDFVATQSINIVSPASPDIFVAVEDVIMELPSICRAHRPIPMDKVKVQPFNATGQSIQISPIRPNDPEFKGGLCMAFRPNTENESYWKNNYNIDMDNDYDWSMDCFYLYPYEDGTIKFVCSVPNGIEVASAAENSTWEESQYHSFLPAYQQVANIENIPEVIYANGKDDVYVLDPKCYTNIEITAKHPNTYDEEIPSYTDIKWNMKDRGTTTVTTITQDGIISTGEADVGKKITIRAEVPQGLHEAYTWYDREFTAQSYYHDFEITIEADPNKSTAKASDPLLTLKLKDGSDVAVLWLSQFSRLANHKDQNFTISISGKSFKKSDITEVEFWKDSTANDTPTSLRSFGCNFTSLTKIDRIPNTITGKQCLMEFLENCTKFNQAITIPTRLTGEECLHAFLKNCTMFNSAITIPNGVTGKGAMKRFLVGCVAFNQAITVPSSLTGEQCMMRFMEGCTKFNQDLALPSNLTGDRCLDHFLFNCTAFNRAITIPDKIAGVACMRGFMRQTWNMMSTITISEEAADNCEINGLTFACFERNKPTFNNGIIIAGTGATKFKEKCPNATDTLPIRKLK